MLAERFLPSLFDQIATVAVTHSMGRCTDLAALEKVDVTDDANSRNSSTKPKAADGKELKGTGVVAAAISESAILTEWKSSQSILAWARVQPSIAEIDLRPYLFVTKDKKDYFGPASVLGHLAVVAEKLLGPKLSVQTLESELKQLARPEAEKLFEAVRTKIMSGDTFDSQPAGIEGMVVLVKAQPTLQSRLLDFLNALPSSRCGPWVVGGWQSVFKDTDALARLDRLLDGWSKVTSNQMLKLAAEAALKTPKGGR